jgi:hypothetical protein
MIDHHHEAFTRIQRLFHLIDPQPLKPVAYRRPRRYDAVDAQPLEKRSQCAYGTSQANQSSQIRGEGNHACSVTMSADRRIFWEIDRLLGVIKLSLCFSNPLDERFDLFLFLSELLFLLFYLGSQFVDLMAEPFGSS